MFKRDIFKASQPRDDAFAVPVQIVYSARR